MMTREQADCEYIGVAAGAGAGTLAARLAEAGRTVILLEAGGDPRKLCGHNPMGRGVSLPEDSAVPAFHPLASENDALKWDFFVRHSEQVGGVLYPRAGTLGGCTAHNAMILVCPA